MSSSVQPLKPQPAAGRNIENLALNSTRGLKIYDLLRAEQVFIEQSALTYINEFFGPQAKPEPAA